nr:hypothetical protein [uncultured Prevotella sp.]
MIANHLSFLRSNPKLSEHYESNTQQNVAFPSLLPLRGNRITTRLVMLLPLRGNVITTQR